MSNSMSDVKQKNVPLGRNADELEFLPAALEVLETPPRPAGRLIAITICLFFAAAIVWAILGSIDTIAIATGQLVTSERANLIQPIENGVVRAIHVRDGQQVRQGEVLVELDPTEAEANVEALRNELVKAQLEVSGAIAILSTNPTENFEPPPGAAADITQATRLHMIGEHDRHMASLAAIDADIDDQRAALTVLEVEKSKLNETLPIVDERAMTLQSLLQKGLARKPETLQLRQTYIEMAAEAEANLAEQRQAMARIEARRKKRRETVAAFRAQHLEKRADAMRRLASLRQQIRKEQRRARDRMLTAPLDGTVFGLSVFTVGGVVTTKDVLMRLVPAGSKIEAEVVVLNRDIGFVEEGQDVEIKLETFPFTRYGLIDGTVKQIWRDAIPDENKGLIYKAVVQLKQSRILVGSDWIPLAPGMSVQAEIKTGARRVIQFFLSPFLRYRDESLRER